MTEDEKKAIEYMNRYIKEDKEQIEILNRINDDDGEYEEEAKFITERIKKFEILINLIEKQQKSLENSVPKEAIRNYIEKLDKELKKYTKEIDGMKFITTTFLKKEDKKLVESIIVQKATLKEILGE